MAVVPVTTSPPQQLTGLAGLPESTLWFIVLFRLVKAMPTSVISSTHPRGKELVFLEDHVNTLHFWNYLSFHLSSQPLGNLCFHPRSRGNSWNLQRGILLYSINSSPLKLLTMEHQQEANWVTDLPHPLLLQIREPRLQGKAMGSVSSTEAASLQGAKQRSPKCVCTDTYVLMMYM